MNTSQQRIFALAALHRDLGYNSKYSSELHHHCPDLMALATAKKILWRAHADVWAAANPDKYRGNHHKLLADGPRPLGYEEIEAEYRHHVDTLAAGRAFPLAVPEDLPGEVPQPKSPPPAAYGPNSDAVREILDRALRLTEPERDALAAADADRDENQLDDARMIALEACQEHREAADEAASSVAGLLFDGAPMMWPVIDAVRAAIVRDLIPDHTYRVLTGAWAFAVRTAGIREVEATPVQRPGAGARTAKGAEQ